MPGDSESLNRHRPEWLHAASSKFFRQQGKAGKDRAYGAVGGPNYTINEIRRNEVGWDLVAHHDDPKALRILDLGTGDGHILLSLHDKFGIPWANLVGVSAEDMRGMPEVLDVKDCKDSADLREVQEAAASYVVWNIEDLQACPSLEGRQFDIIISWITFCWLTDPFGVLEAVHDHFLADQGLLVLGSLQMLVKDVPSIEDQLFLAALRDRLLAEGHRVDVFRDPVNGVYSWWLQRKMRDSLKLWPLLRYDALVEESLKVAYVTELSPGPELEEFAVSSIKVL